MVFKIIFCSITLYIVDCNLRSIELFSVGAHTPTPTFRYFSMVGPVDFFFFEAVLTLNARSNRGELRITKLLLSVTESLHQQSQNT